MLPQAHLLTLTLFSTSGPWLSRVVSPPDCGLPVSLFHASLQQNEVLFSADGLTLVALDRLYSLKSALSSYSNTLSPLRLEDAVDELRRFVLANRGAAVARADLLRSYDWLRVSRAALTDLDAMYRRAYGGPEGTGAITGMPRGLPLVPLSPAHLVLPERAPPMLAPGVFGEAHGPAVDPSMIGIALTTPEPAEKAPSSKGPVLQLQTSLDVVPATGRAAAADDGGNDDGDVTARPEARPMVGHGPPWANALSIDQVLSAAPVGPPPPRARRRDGPATPKDADDMSPVTRSEWSLLMDHGALGGGRRTVAVETC